MKLITRLSKAAYERCTAQDRKPEYMSQKEWDDLGAWENQNPILYQHWDQVIRTILEAMRDHPTADMMDHLADAMGDTPECHEQAPNAWSAAIDEALDE